MLTSHSQFYWTEFTLSLLLTFLLSALSSAYCNRWPILQALLSCEQFDQGWYCLLENLNKRILSEVHLNICCRCKKQTFSEQKYWQDIFFLFPWLRFCIPVNSYGHVEMISSPKHTFSWASLTKHLTSTVWTYFLLWLTTTLVESTVGEEWP